MWFVINAFGDEHTLTSWTKAISTNQMCTKYILKKLYTCYLRIHIIVHLLRYVSIHYFMMKSSLIPVWAESYVWKYFISCAGYSLCLTLLYQSILHFPSKLLECYHKHSTALQMPLSTNKSLLKIFLQRLPTYVY